MHLPKTTVEQRSRFYEDVESMLSPGFLSHQVLVSGVRLQLRSLSNGDLFMLRARTLGCDSREWRVWAIASAIWMINGQMVLGQDTVIPFLADKLRMLPDLVLNILFTTLLGLWVRMGEAISATEFYNYESLSRYKWISQKGQRLTSGVPGADSLGLNTVQRIWGVFNEMEDTRRTDESSWEGFKLVASSNAPKAITKIDEKDRQRKTSEMEMREKRLDEFYYIQLGVLEPSQDGSGSILSSHRMASKSVEDLEEEMRRWVTGDGDIHDRTVEAYKENIRARHEAEEAVKASQRAALEAERARQYREAEEDSFQPKPLLALTGEQLQRMLQDRGSQGMPGVSFIPKAPQAEKLYARHIAQNAVSTGNLRVADGRVVDPEFQPDTDIRTLNELIQQRKPSFGTGD